MVVDQNPVENSFAAVSALVPVSPGRFDAVADPQWTINGKPNGGYLLALLGRAAATASTHEHVISASAVYLRSPEPGALVVEAEVLRAGKSASQLRARLLQNDQVCVDALIITSTLDPAAEPYWHADSPTPGDASRDEGIRVPGVNPAGLPVPIMNEVDLRLDRSCMGFASGNPSGAGELRGWLELPGGEQFDPTSLLYAVDALPPATLDVAMTGWVPTLALTAYVRALPAPGPVRVIQRAHLVDSQRVDESCWVWDVRGRLVAQATQLAGIRLG